MRRQAAWAALALGCVVSITMETSMAGRNDFANNVSEHLPVVTYSLADRIFQIDRTIPVTEAGDSLAAEPVIIEHRTPYVIYQPISFLNSCGSFPT